MKYTTGNPHGLAAGDWIEIDYGRVRWIPYRVSRWIPGPLWRWLLRRYGERKQVRVSNVSATTFTIE